MATSGNIQCHYDSCKKVHDISTVSVRYRYESMRIHEGNATVNPHHGGTANAHVACTVWGRSFLSVAWPTGVQLVFFFCSGVSRLFGAQGSPSSGSLLNL